MLAKQSVILFDGFCNLCNGTVDFLIKKDRKKQFLFVPLQSKKGKLFIQKFQIPIETDSVILIRFNKVFFESDAAIEIVGMLNYPWKLGIIARFIPEKIRNNLYKIIVRNRYQCFGKRETCRIPNLEENEFFKIDNMNDNILK